MRLTKIDSKTILPALVFAFVLTAHAQTKSDASGSLFAYTQNSPLSVKEVSAEKRGDVTVRDITSVSYTHLTLPTILRV